MVLLTLSSTSLVGHGTPPAPLETAHRPRLSTAPQGRELWGTQTPFNIVDPKPALAATRPSFNAYGLGFNLRDYRGMKVVSHSGALQGFYSLMVMVPPFWWAPWCSRAHCLHPEGRPPSTGRSLSGS